MLVYLFNKCCNQSTQHILIKNKATCFGHKRIAIFRPELFLMKICCVEWLKHILYLTLQWESATLWYLGLFIDWSWWEWSINLFCDRTLEFRWPYFCKHKSPGSHSFKPCTPKSLKSSEMLNTLKKSSSSAAYRVGRILKLHLARLFHRGLHQIRNYLTLLEDIDIYEVCCLYGFFVYHILSRSFVSIYLSLYVWLYVFV